MVPGDENSELFFTPLPLLHLGLLINAQSSSLSQRR